MRPSSATKENRKGYTHSYNYRRRLLITICILSTISFFVWHLCAKLSTSSYHIHNDSVKSGTISNHPIRSIEYGVQSTPVVMIRTSLDEELHKRFLQEHLYSCTETELNTIPELDNRVKEPVYVYEGYYHSLPMNDKIYSKNPNPLIGTDFYKPPASAFTRAFYDAFRHVNKNIFDTLKHNLLKVSSYNNITMQGEDVCYILAQWIDKGYHFGDLSIQIHYGTGNEQKLTSGAAWHTDAENSLLHLAVTLRGNRVLHSKRLQMQQQSNSTTTLLRQSPRNQVPVELLERQTPRDVYLSSSTLIRHAPQFFDTDYANRVIAIHARILYTSADVNHFRKVRTKDGWEKLTNVLANTLAAANIQIPSLAQVESSLSMLP